MATYTSDNATQWASELINETSFFQEGNNFIIPLAVITILGILISPRKLSNLKILALPLMIGGTMAFGLNIPMIFMVLASILFVMETLTTKVIGEGISVLTQKISGVMGAEETIRRSRIDKALDKLSYDKGEDYLEKARRKGETAFPRGTSITAIANIRKSIDEQIKYLQTEKEKIIKKEMVGARSFTDQIDRLIQRLKKEKEKGKAGGYFKVDE